MKRPQKYRYFTTCLSNQVSFFLFLTDPVFVGSAYIEESQPIGNPVGDDDKIYFFFSEAGKEFDFFDNTIVSRIARVCKVRHLRGGVCVWWVGLRSLHGTAM